MNDQPEIPFGYCQCGCGQRTKPYTSTRRQLGHVKGEPRRFLPGHNHKLKGNATYVVDEATGCWTWQGAKTDWGYGRICVGKRANQRAGGHDGKRQWAAHRWYYTQAKGPIPEGMDLDHLCRNRLCVNPDHLQPVSEAENIRRGKSAKLAADDVREIRRLAGEVTQHALAKRYGVSVPTICLIVNRVNWRDLN